MDGVRSHAAGSESARDDPRVATVALYRRHRVVLEFLRHRLRHRFSIAIVPQRAGTPPIGTVCGAHPGREMGHRGQMFSERAANKLFDLIETRWFWPVVTIFGAG